MKSLAPLRTASRFDRSLARHAATRLAHSAALAMPSTLDPLGGHVMTGLMQRLVRRDKPADRREWKSLTSKE